MVALPARVLAGHWFEDHSTHVLVTTDPLGKLQESKMKVVPVSATIVGWPGTTKESLVTLLCFA